MRLILFLVLISCSVFVKSGSNPTKDDEKELSKANVEDENSNRQFSSYLRKWIFGRSEEKQTTKMTHTKIKYLPIYVPIPVYSDRQEPPTDDFYGAYKRKKDKEKVEIGTLSEVLNKPSLPYPHNHRHNLSYSGQLLQMLNRQSFPFYFKPYEDQWTKPTQASSSGSNYKPPQQFNGGYDYNFDDSSEEVHSNDYDSVVVNNPELIDEPDDERVIEVNLRKRKRYNKKKLN